MKLEVGHGATQVYVNIQVGKSTADPKMLGDGGASLAPVASN